MFDADVVWLGIREQTSQRHMFQRDWTTPSNVNNYSTLKDEHKSGGHVYQVKQSTTHALHITITK